MRSAIRRTIYRVQDLPITLALVACIAPPRWSEKNHPPPRPRQRRMVRALNRLGYAATVRRIMREGA